MAFREHLEQACAGVDGAVVCSVMGFDGIPIDTFEPKAEELDVTAFLVEYTTLLNQVRAASGVLQSGEVQELALSTEKLTALSRPLSKDCYLLLVLSPKQTGARRATSCESAHPSSKRSYTRDPMAEVIDTSEFRKGLKIEVEGDPFEIVDFQHVKPGKGGAFVRTKIKNLLTGNTLERTFRSGDKVGRPDIEEKEMQYLYAEGQDFYFMDNKSYEQTFLTPDALGDSKNFLKANINASILFYKGRAIGVSLPNAVDLAVTKCDPGLRGDTVRGPPSPRPWRRASRRRCRSSSTRATCFGSTRAAARTSRG